MWHAAQLIQRVEISKIIGMTRREIHGAGGRGPSEYFVVEEQ